MSKELNFYEALEVMRKGKICVSGYYLYKVEVERILVSIDGGKTWFHSVDSYNYLITYKYKEYTEEPKPVKMVDKWLWANQEGEVFKSKFNSLCLYDTPPSSEHTVKLEWSKASFPISEE